MKRTISLTALIFSLSACGGVSPKALETLEREGVSAAVKTTSSSYPLYGKYPPIMMLSKYAREGSEGEAEGEGEGEGEGEPRVEYWSDEQRAKHRVSARGGLLVNPQGVPLDADLDNPKNAHRTGSALFVMDLNGEIYFTFDQRFGLLHHSSLAGGGPVAAAGELVVMKGELVSISNASGHYRPPPSTLDLVWARLVELGVDMRRAERFEVLGDPDAPPPERLSPPPPRGAQSP